MPLIVGELKVLPKHWWEGTDQAGRKRDIGATTLEPPLGNSAYRLKASPQASTRRALVPVPRPATAYRL
jgi:ABC-type oligopeptide transport system substrate-binding subunit